MTVSPDSNAQGGNYVLANLAQEANVGRRSVLLYPTPVDWADARAAADCIGSTADDMHAGEAETSILMHIVPQLVRPSWSDADWEAHYPRRLLTLIGVDGYSPNGVIGRRSAATPDKGRRLLEALTAGFDYPLKRLRSEEP